MDTENTKRKHKGFIVIATDITADPYKKRAWLFRDYKNALESMRFLQDNLDEWENVNLFSLDRFTDNDTKEDIII